MIYTSYYGKLRRIPKDIARVSICRIAPKDYHGLQYKKLSPSLEMMLYFKRNENLTAYSDRFYKEVLNILDPSEVMLDLSALTEGANQVVLLCYEKNPETCHRAFVADWLNENGIACEEWNEVAHQKDMPIQLRMEI